MAFKISQQTLLSWSKVNIYEPQMVIHTKATIKGYYTDVS